MLKSMTAYARASTISPLGRFVVEIQSVNRKHLEISTYLPKELLRYDSDIKKWIAAAVGRGQLNVKLSVTFDRSSPLVVTPNLALARQLKSAWSDIAQDLGLSLSPEAFLRILSNEKEILLYDEDFQDENVYRKALNEVFSQALQQLVAMKIREGKSLHEDISQRFAKLSVLIKDIAAKAPGATERHRQKLVERLNELMGPSIENDDRIMREIGIYAERIDIAEELTRFNSHLSQVEDLLNDIGDGGIGKTLEFLMQELNREINTISSKSSDTDVSRFAIEIKSELERIREQIQNIE